jgi:hypothetical protein
VQVKPSNFSGLRQRFGFVLVGVNIVNLVVKCGPLSVSGSVIGALVLKLRLRVVVHGMD